MRLGLGELLGAGSRAVSRYTGTVFAVFVAQSLLALAVTLGIAVVLAQQFAHLPMFDEAVDGDLVAAIWCLRYARTAFLAIGAIVFAALVLWQLVTWFLVGGLVGVFAQRPEGRADTARCFGASGAATYLAFARLAVCSLPGIFLVLFLWGTGIALVEQRLVYALTLWDLLWPLIVASLPALLALHFFWTVAEYARIELALRHDTHAPGVIATYVRSFVYVVRRPITLAHGALGWLLFLVVTLAYAYLAQGHPMYGAEGAITLFFVRQGVALLRAAIKIAILAGQVELGRTRPLPPRRAEAKVDAKA
ncbi:MAG: hypothetical protein KIT31_38525 [Deltaproteobacteria bacterium]|nr:hypothetical protein [Deltaproteobacteria bacterium]